MRPYALILVVLLAVQSNAGSFFSKPVYRPTLCKFFNFACLLLTAEDAATLIKKECNTISSKPGHYTLNCTEDEGGDLTKMIWGWSQANPTSAGGVVKRIIADPSQAPYYCGGFKSECSQICAGYPKSRKESCSVKKLANGSYTATAECYCGHVDFAAWIHTDVENMQ